jgi:hypothetical protein
MTTALRQAVKVTAIPAKVLVTARRQRVVVVAVGPGVETPMLTLTVTPTLTLTVTPSTLKLA